MIADDRGAVTVEAAIAIATLVIVMVACVGAIVAASAQIRCVDAAREAARLAARGDQANAEQGAARVAPRGARIAVRRDGDDLVATVTAHTPLLPGIELRATAFAAAEPETGP